MSGVEAFTLVLSGGGVSTGNMVLLLVQVAGQSSGNAVTSLIGMLEAAALFSRTSTSFNRQSAALLQAPDIHSKVIL